MQDLPQRDHEKQQQLPSASTTRAPAVKRDLLARYYPTVDTLRDYLLARLPSSSRLRRKKLLSVGKSPEASAVEQLLSHMLDTALVTYASSGSEQSKDQPAADYYRERQSLRQTFSQTKRADESYVTVSSAAEGVFSPQAEVVDFVVWLLFSRSKKTGLKGFGSSYPDNVLCHGYKRGQKPPAMPRTGPETYPASTVPGLSTIRNPQNAQTLKDAPWPQLLAILGASAEKIMTDLLLECSLFLSLDAGVNNYIQVTGQPLFKVFSAKVKGQDKARQPSEIVFARNNILYCRPGLTSGGRVHFGLSSNRLKISEVKWLAPPKLKYEKMSLTDSQKRQAIFTEFLFFVFDAFLIPLIAANFYVTESSTHRNQLFYFRHDVWRRIEEPAMTALVSARLEPLELKEAMRLIEDRGLGFGKLRLLPKKAAMRPIVNLRRAIPKKGDPRTAPSINTVLRPIAAMLNLEMKEHPERLGSGMLSTHGIYARLKGFRERMHAKNKHVFYFAKVDVLSAFDTIPQKAMVKLIGTVPEHPAYNISHHVEIAPTRADTSRKITASEADGPLVQSKKGTAAAPRQVWRTVAKASDDLTGFHDDVEGSIAQNKRNTVFVDGAYVRTHYAEPLAKLAATHIQDNIVKVGDKYYRQKEGIPQGSVLSSTLCSYFYADLEEKELGFLKAPAGAEDEDCILFRLIDDFLVISTNRAKAAHFIEVMQRGHPTYGVAVNPSKSLVNFALEIDGKPVPRLAAGQSFPYCGTTINCMNLNLTRDRDTKAQTVFNTITVEHLRSQGYHFKRKIFNYFQIQSHHMFFDTSFNSRRTALSNLHAAFAETANKMWAYARCMPKTKRPSTRLTISTIEEVGAMAQGILNGKRRAEKSPAYEFSVSKAHLRYILLHAFFIVLGKKQTGYKDVLKWLRGSMQQLREKGRLRLPQQFMLERRAN
ncbi:Telomerase reverse transcriptase [Sporothrix bragantina]|uniref:Telomerase reverse transcriptase n=1 Tax=Sporothrix bragantina TaxID=671064 RepID=A0ABP0BV78_9PEZI